MSISPSRLLTSCFLAAVSWTAIAQETSENPSDAKWDIETSRAPSTTSLSFTATEGTWMSVDVAPDGTKLAFDLLGHIYELPTAGGTARALTSGRSWNMFPRYSPDGSELTFTSDRSGSEEVWVIELASRELEKITERPGLPVVRPTWSQSGNGIYASELGQEANSKGLRFNRHGDAQELLTTGTFQPANQFAELPEHNLVLFEHLDQQLHSSGARIKAYDLETGETSVYRERPGGAFNPTVSRDGKLLAYGHRDDQDTVLVVHDIETRAERVVVRGLDRDHQEYGAYYYGVSPNVSWGPDGRLYYSARGGLWSIAADGTQARAIPFEAPVDRKIDQTLRLTTPLPRQETQTLAHRFAHRTELGIVYESLGDLFLQSGGERQNLTSSTAHETSPIIDPTRRLVYYASWTDQELGHIARRALDGGPSERLVSRPSQYFGLALSADGNSLAYFRGQGRLVHGLKLEAQARFDLMVLGPDGNERLLTQVNGTPNTQARLPLTVRFGDDGWIYYTEFQTEAQKEKLSLRRIRPDGTERTTLADFPHAERVVLAPDLRWLAFREYHRTFVSPLDWIGKTVTISAEDQQGTTFRVDADDAAYVEWSPDGASLTWPRGGRLYTKPLSDIVEGNESEPSTQDIAITYEVARPEGRVALTNARVLTMDAERTVLDSATVLIERDEILSVGADVAVPADAKVYDLGGHTIIPGLVDAHGHPDPGLSQSHIIEQRLPGISAALAYGVTTLYELYGTEEKEPWVRDMIQSGRMTGPRLLTVGAPMYGLREFRPKTYRPIDSYQDALEHARYSKAQGVTALKDYVNFTRSDRHQLIAAAREVGINVVSETAGNAPMNFTQIVDGVTGLEHSMGLTPLYQDVLELFKASSVGVTPTLLVVYNGPSGQAFFDQSSRVWEDEKLLRFQREDNLRAFRRVQHFWDDDLYAPEMASEMKKLFDAGVLINAGGHGQMLGLDMHWEMELFVQGGFTPMDTLQTATINSATYHGLGDQLGSIEVGKLADLVVLRSDPLADIRNARDIRFVMVGGVLFDGNDAARVWPDPQPAPGFYFHR